MRVLKLVIAGISIVFASGCATLTTNEMQQIFVTTQHAEDQGIEKAKCSLKNDRGVWQVDSPGTVEVRRSTADLLVECKKEGSAEGLLRAVSRSTGGIWGNVIGSHGVGALVDYYTGIGYTYPRTLPVKMGASVTVDRRDEERKVAAEKTESTKPD